MLLLIIVYTLKKVTSHAAVTLYREGAGGPFQGGNGRSVRLIIDFHLMLRLRIVSISHDGVEIVEARCRPPLPCYFRDFLFL